MARRSANTIRIIGGAWRGRLIRFGKDLPVRPTPARVRETVFNWLGQDLTGKRCLDLFAGTGALGFESLSRNAAHVTFVDQSRAVCAQLRSTATTLDAARFEIHCCTAIEFLRRHPARTASTANAARPSQSGVDGPPDRASRFDVAFLDPPYGSALLEHALAAVGEVMAAGGTIYFESDVEVGVPHGWRIVRQSRAGMVHFGLAVREEP